MDENEILERQDCLDAGAVPDDGATEDLIRRVNDNLPSDKKEKTPLTKKELVKKICTWAVTALSVIIAIFSVTFAISAIVSSKKGYTSMAGFVYYTVMSNSMDGEPTLNDVRFEKGDVIYGKVLKDDEKNDLKVGEVITFWDSVTVDNGAKSVRALNSHTIIERIEYPDGTVRYRTQGNNPITNPDPDPTLRKAEDVVSVYVGQSKGFGNMLMWLNSETGFIVCVLVPSLLIVVYCIVMVIINAVNYNKKKFSVNSEKLKATVKDEITDEMRAEMRLQIMKELGLKGETDGTDDKDDKTDDQKSPTDQEE